MGATTYDPRVHVVAKFVEEARELIEDIMLGVWEREAERFCESEIEKQFYYAWTAQRMWNEMTMGGDYKSFEYDTAQVDLDQCPAVGENVLQVDVFKPQHRIESFRVDFAIRRFLRQSPGIMVGGPKMVIECDGHDFHERTKEQAAADKSRDRLLQTWGYNVLRFTGSEIWKNSTRCVEQVEECMNEHFGRAAIEQMKLENAEQLAEKSKDWCS
jgi:very-short-patch-repair endonuclease